MLRKIEDRWWRGRQIVGQYQLLNADEFEQAPGVGDGQGSLAYCRSLVCKESNVTELLN